MEHRRLRGVASVAFSQETLDTDLDADTSTQRMSRKQDGARRWCHAAIALVFSQSPFAQFFFTVRL
jgi:hypothetical protein